MAVYILPYRPGSEGARMLSEKMGAPIIAPDDIADLGVNDQLINWGGGFVRTSQWKPTWLNYPGKIMNAVDKDQAFRIFSEWGVPCPAYTQNISTARRWQSKGSLVVVRTNTGGMMGRGISLVRPGESMPTAPLYTRHVLHKTEYRIHVFKGRVVNVGKKVKDGDNADDYIRNWGDWKFANPSVWPGEVAAAGIAAVDALELDFGAVDIGFDRDTRAAHVFEVNTAPGAGHYTISRYAQAFKEYFDALQSV